MIFLTLDGHHIDLAQAQRIYTGRRALAGRMCWVILVEVAGQHYALCSTGDDRLQAQFHCKALRQCQQNGTL